MQLQSSQKMNLSVNRVYKSLCEMTAQTTINGNDELCDVWDYVAEGKLVGVL